MWFRKKKVVNSGITFNEWVKDHIEDKKYLRVYTGKDGTFKQIQDCPIYKSSKYKT